MGQCKSLKQIFSKFVYHFDLEGQGYIFFRIIQDLYKMINTQLKFEGKIPTVQKLLHSQEITPIFFSFKANLTLKVKVKVTTFQTRLRYLDA